MILDAEGHAAVRRLPRAEGAKQAQMLEAEGRKEAAFRDAEARERSARPRPRQPGGERVDIQGDVAALNYLSPTNICAP